MLELTPAITATAVKSAHLIRSMGNLTIPRDRNGIFENHTLPAYGRHSDSLETTVIQLYTKGITTAEIAELIEKMYGTHYSKSTVSNMTKAVDEQVQAFQQRRLASQYASVF